MPIYRAKITVSRIYELFIEASDIETADIAAWNIDHAALHKLATLDYGETEHVSILDSNATAAHVSVDEHVEYGYIIYEEDFNG